MEDKQQTDNQPQEVDYSKQIQTLQIENNLLKQNLQKVEKERDEANALYLATGKKTEIKSRTYDSLIKELK